MTRTAKISKLGHAIREYRGVTHQDHPNKWIKPPVPSARKRIERWLAELGLDISGSMTLIKSFKSFEEYRAWVRSI